MDSTPLNAQSARWVGAVTHPLDLTERVGMPYDAAQPVWPEGAAYWVGPDDRHRLLIALPDVGDDERKSVATDAIQVGVATSGPALFLLWKTWHADWSDCPYSTHLQFPARLDAPGRITLEIVLVESRTGVIQARRQAPLSAEVSQALRAALVAQQALAWDEAAFDAAVQKVYRQFEPDQLAERAPTCQIPVS